MNAETAVMKLVDLVNIFIINKMKMTTIEVISTGKKTILEDKPS
jgi:hypothetical protein